MTFKPDRGWSWVVLAATFVSFLINGTNLYSIGIIQIALLEKYQDSITKTATIVSLCSSLSAIAGCLAVVVINKVNSRACQLAGGLMLFSGLTASAFVDNIDALMVTYGIIAGTGTGMCATACLVCIGYYFSRLRPLAVGVTVGGAGIGMFCGSVLIRALLNTYDMHGMFLILGGINGNMFVTGLLMRPSFYEEQKFTLLSEQTLMHGLKQNIREMVTLLPKLYRNKAYVFFVITTAAWFFCISSIMVHEPAHAVSVGVATENEAALLATVYGICNTISRYLVGFSTTRSGLDPMLVHIGQMALAGTVCVTFPLYSSTYTGHVCFCAIVGFYTGGLFAQNTPITCDILGMEQFASGLGILSFLGGLAWFSGPPLIGAILDNGGTYGHGFILLGIVFYLGTFANLFAGTFHKQHELDTDNKDFEVQVPADEELMLKETDEEGTVHLIVPRLHAMQALGLSLRSLTSFPTYPDGKRMSISTPQLNT